MIQQTIQSLTALVRTESGLRNNQVLSDTDIYGFLAEAYADLRDRLIVRFAHWFRKEQSFTLAGGPDGYIFDLTTIPDFQMLQGLDLEVSPGLFVSVNELGSFAERNQFNGTWPFLGMTWGYNGVLGRMYFVNGDNLEVLPPQNAQGTYRAVYTPMQQLAAKVTQPITIATGDSWFNNGGKLSWLFANLSFIPDYTGGQLTVNLNAPNAAYNGTYTIDTTLTGSAQVNTTAAYIGGTTTFPAVGTASITYQPLGSTDTLPDKLLPWYQYLVLYAAIAVRNSREQDVTALSARFGDIKERVIALTKQRTEGARQAPITRNRYGRFGYGSYFGG